MNLLSVNRESVRLILSSFIVNNMLSIYGRAGTGLNFSGLSFFRALSIGLGSSSGLLFQVVELV